MASIKEAEADIAKARIYDKLESLIPKIQVDYLLWQEMPEMLDKKPKTFEEFKKEFQLWNTQKNCERWKSTEEYQKAQKVLKHLKHNARMLELYDIYFEKAKDDTNAFKAFIEFSNNFFTENEENELLQILKGVDIDD